MRYMNKESQYDVVLEMDYPHGESSEAVYDTWAREIKSLIHKLFTAYPGVQGHRVVRSAGHLKIALRVLSLGMVGKVISFSLPAVASRSPNDITIKIHESKEQDENNIQEVQALGRS